MSKFTFTKYEKDNSELPSANIYIYSLQRLETSSLQFDAMQKIQFYFN